MNIHIFDQQKDLSISPSLVTAIVQQVISLEEKSCDEVAVHFVDVSTISELHYRFFDDRSVTDCISLPIDPPGEEDYCILGEVFVCPQTAIDYAKQHHYDPYYETTLYLVHGILHLLGYEDIGDAEPKMRAAEKRHMQYLEKHKLILGPNP